MYINPITSTNSPKQFGQQQAFGHVIKTRFFEMLPDGSKVQVQDKNILQGLAKRLCFHLTQPEKHKKGRIPQIVDFMRDFDKDYRYNPNLRRVYSFNCSYDHYCYLITGKDADVVDSVAHSVNLDNKKSLIIETQLDLVQNSELRPTDMDSEEVALNVFLRKGVNSDTGKTQYFFKGIKAVKERLMCFPYRRRGENLE